MTRRFVRTALYAIGLSLVVVTFVPVTQNLPRADAATSAYSVAIGGCFEQTPPAGTGVPPTVSDYIEVQAYGLPASATLTEPDGIPNTAFYVQGGNPAQPGGTPIAAPVHNGVPSEFLAGLNGGVDLSVQVAYVAPDNTVQRLPVLHITLPTAASCGTTGTTTVSTPPGRVTAPIVGVAATHDGEGYWLVGSDGRVYSFGDALDFAAPTGEPDLSAPVLSHPIVGMAATPDGMGYWLVASDGGIFAYGDAAFFGSTGAMSLNRPIVGMTPTSSGRGYWLVASDGGLFAFGDAAFHGSMGSHPLNRPVVGMAADRATGGYWLVASDGGVFSFDAPFYGSTGDITLNQPIVGMEAASDGSGYRFVASDGGIFSYDLAFSGSLGNQHLNEPIVGMAADGASGYWLVASDGGLFSFVAPFFGSAG